MDKVWATFEAELQVLDDLLESIGDVAVKQDRYPKSPKGVVTLHLFARGIKSAQAYYLLFLNGYSQEASMVLRSLTETVIDLNYILTKPGPLVKQFMSYSTIGFRLWIRRMHEVLPDDYFPPDARRVEDEVEQEYQRLIKKNPQYRELRDKWAALSVRERAKLAGCIPYYVHWLEACKMLHTDPRSISSYIRRGPGILIDAGQTLPKREEVHIDAAVACTLDLYSRANQVLRWRQGQLVQEFRKRFKDVFHRQV